MPLITSGAMQVVLTYEERSKLTALAAGGGRLGCLKVLRGWEYPLDHATWEAAAGGGHLPTLRYLREETEAFDTGQC
jgi:hypothetical protein